MNKFGLISEIDVDEPNSWQDRIFITLDIDWANDLVLKDTIDIISQYGARATFFTTHDTPLNSLLCSNEDFELGIHPNFNFLLNGDFEKGANFNQILDNTHSYAPFSTSVRSHSITQNGPILDAFVNKGISHDSNDYIPEYSLIELKPWKTANGLIKVPYCWADEHAFTGKHINSFQDIFKNTGLTVFDFHPIHIYLNTEKAARYEKCRAFHNSPDELLNYRCQGYGTRSRFKELLMI